MSGYSLEINSINKTFGRRLIFDNLNFDLTDDGIFGIAGANGSGKSTLVKIIAGIISPSSGKVIHKNSGKEIIPEKLHDYIGFVSPYLVMYEEFSALENLKIFSSIRCIQFNEKRSNYLFDHFNLSDRKNDLVKTYSSGMKQRLKFIFALIHEPELIILDEPTSNLDEAGKDAVYQIVKKESKKKIYIIASNEKTDLALCENKIVLEDFKK